MRFSADSGVIDLHTHIVPQSIPAYAGVGNDGQWPSIFHHRACCAQVIISGKVYREIESSCWDIVRRRDEMMMMNAGIQVLSPMPELLSYWMTPQDGAALGRCINDDIASMVDRDPQSFRGVGMVPLQSVDAAIETLGYIMNDLKLDGVEIGTNVNGRPIGDPMFEPFFAAAEDLDALVFVHPLRAAGRDQLIGPPALEQIIAFPCETALAIASLITSGTLYRHPRLKLVFSHGGGAFAQILPRLQHAWTFIPDLQERIGAAPVELARKLYFDSLVYSPVALKFLIEQFGVEQIVVGTDYPFAIMDKTPMQSVAALNLNERDFLAVCRGNAGRLLRTDKRDI